MARLADPVLPLQTMNRTCIEVRAAAEAAKPEAFTPNAAALDHLLRQATDMRIELRHSYAFVKANPLLKLRYEEAGAQIGVLIATLARMRAEA
ncbi:hypothetical protein [Polaromonas sp. YR568]|uniref:hypothetical protein n=1 Tax=Polaromonas sp. YR568 TaxID=1855301 RepID=UPI003137A793